MMQPITDEAQLFCFIAFRWQILLAKQARMERVLHLFHVDQLSTWCIGERLNISEEAVCQILEEAERGR